MNIDISNTLFLIVVLGVCLAGVELVSYSVRVLVLGALSKLRKRKRDQRIIQQAKAAKVWDKPGVLGGRALELKAWQNYKIKREPGETDACLRRKYADATKQRTATLEG